MMYEALLFDMNALGDIPDKDFTSRAALAGSSPCGGRGAEAEAQVPIKQGSGGPAPFREAETRSLLLSKFWVLRCTSYPLTSSRV